MRSTARHTNGSATPAQILVVDDEPMVCEIVTRYLEQEGFAVETADNGHEAQRRLADAAPDLVILDVMLPGIDGLSLLRGTDPATRPPVIVLSARTDEVDRIVGLELGADDYVTKPFSPRELVARVRSVLRRAHPPEHQGADRLRFGELVIDRASREVHLSGDHITLTQKEFDLLAKLAAEPRRVFSRDQLLQAVWDSSAAWQDPATVTVHVGRLRRKIDPDDRGLITTVWGVGYRFDP
jgi:DNA-binding response OmpR family regulator